MRGMTHLALAALVALAVAGCGDEEGKQIPADQAAELQARLGEVKRRLDPLRCGDLREDSLPAIAAQIAALPGDLDGDVRQSLEDGFEELQNLVDSECAEPTEPPPTETETTPTTPEQTAPEEEPTVPEEPTEPEEPPEAPPPQDEGDGGEGNGRGGGSGGTPGPGAGKPDKPPKGNGKRG